MAQLLDDGGDLRLEHADWDVFSETVRKVVESGVQGAGRIFDAKGSLALLDALERAADAAPAKDECGPREP